MPEQAPAAAEEAAGKPAKRASRRPALKEAATTMQVQLRLSMPTQSPLPRSVTVQRGFQGNLQFMLFVVLWNAGGLQGQAQEGQGLQVSSQRPNSSR